MWPLQGLSVAFSHFTSKDSKFSLECLGSNVHALTPTTQTTYKLSENLVGLFPLHDRHWAEQICIVSVAPNFLIQGNACIFTTVKERDREGRNPNLLLLTFIFSTFHHFNILISDIHGSQHVAAEDNHLAIWSLASEKSQKGLI